MAEKAKKGDFIELEFTGLIKDSNTVFDTTNKELAKKEGLFNEKYAYGGVIICIGQKQVVKGLDDFLEEKDVNTEYEVLVSPEDSFGKKNAKHIKLVPTSIFTKQNIRPAPGMPVNIDNVYGTIITVTGGRTIVDFNHPLSGKELIYKFKITRILKESSEKLKAFLSRELGTEDFKIDIQEGKAKIELKTKLPEQISKLLESKIKEIIPEIKSVEFVRKSSEKAEQNKTNV